MKKLMFAAALVATVTGYGSIQSQHIVGYSSVEIPVGFSMFTPVFENVDSTTFTLGEITVCNIDGVELDDKPAGAGQCRNGIYVQKLKNGQLMVDTQMSYNSAHYANRESYADSWGWGKYRNVEFKAGEALIVNNKNGAVRKFKLKEPVSDTSTISE